MDKTAFCLKKNGVQMYNTIKDWIEQCFTSPPTQYNIYGRPFLQVKRPNQQYQTTEGNIYKGKRR